jgi:hypothetical protein
MFRMRSFPFSVAPFSVTPLVAGVEKVCIRQGPQFDSSGTAILTVPSGDSDRGDRSGEEIYYETKSPDRICAGPSPRPKIGRAQN